MDIIYERPPLPYPAALRAVARCSASTARLLRQHRLRLPARWVGTRLRFADGTSARVYRETVADRGATLDPCVLVVEFRLRAVRGPGHAAFRWESLLNTPLFAGFPGFVSKLWLAHDDLGRYRGFYEWDDPLLAEQLRPGPVADTRPGVRAGIDPLRGAARTAPRRGARPAEPAGRGRRMVAADRRRLTADILVVGAGPAGLALALQAHDHGAAVRVVDRRPEAVRPSRALILHARTLEVLRPLGVTTALLARADTAPAADLRLGARVVRVSFGDLALPGTAFPHLTLVRQMDVERVLAGALAERGVTVERGTELVAVREEPGGVRAVLRTLTGAEQARFGFAIGCDGPASTVRAQAGLGWTGRVYPVEVVLADAELDGALPGDAAQIVAGRDGLLFAFRLGERATWRLLGTRPVTPGRLEPGSFGPMVSIADLQQLIDAAGLDARITDLVLVLPGHGAAPTGQPVSPRSAVPGRGRCARLLPGHRPGHERGHPGRRQPRLEARVRGGQARQRAAARLLRRRAPAGGAPTAGPDQPGVLGRGLAPGRSRPRSAPGSYRSPPRCCPR